MEHSFETPSPIELYVENRAGHITVTAADVDRTDISVTGEHADEFVVEQRGDKIQVVSPKSRKGFGLLGDSSDAHVEVVMPTHSTLTIKSGSADTVVNGDIAGFWCHTGSGDLEVELVDGLVEIQSGSGDLRLGELRGDTRIKSGSGDINVDGCSATHVSAGSGDVRIGSVNGKLSVKTGSGDVEVGEAADDLSLSTGSGDLSVERAHKGRYVIKGASGDVSIGIPLGTPVWTDLTTLSGDVHSGLTPVGPPADGQDHLELRVTTASGDINLHQL